MVKELRGSGRRSNGRFPVYKRVVRSPSIQSTASAPLFTIVVQHRANSFAGLEMPSVSQLHLLGSSEPNGGAHQLNRRIMLKQLRPTSVEEDTAPPPDHASSAASISGFVARVPISAQHCAVTCGDGQKKVLEGLARFATGGGDSGQLIVRVMGEGGRHILSGGVAAWYSLRGRNSGRPCASRSALCSCAAANATSDALAADTRRNAYAANLIASCVVNSGGWKVVRHTRSPYVLWSQRASVPAYRACSVRTVPTSKRVDLQIHAH